MLGLISHADCATHDTGPMHPDTPERLEAIQNQLISSGLDFVVRHYDAPLVERAALDRVHEPAYIDRVFASAPFDGSIEIDGDTVMSVGTLAAAQRAAGAGVLGVDLIMSGEASPVFCAVRPPGHHAERGKAMGFCLFNNIAVASAHALDRHGVERVAIIDFDVHHGNGTEDIFRNDPRVLFCSSFQHPFYPYTGHGSDTKNLVDVPLASGTEGSAYRRAVEDHWLPALHRFQPQFIFVSAGFDAHVLDDMSGLALSDADYKWLGLELTSIANQHAGGRLLSILEGGYEPGSLARSTIAYLKAMM